MENVIINNDDISLNGKHHTRKSIATYRTLFYILGVLPVIILGLPLITLGFPLILVGLFFIVLGIYVISVGIKYSKILKLPNTPVAVVDPVVDDSPYADCYQLKVVGVTFKNGRRSRQTILRQIKFHDEPYDSKVTISFRKYDFEGEPAIGVYANDEQIGNVPKNIIPQFNELWVNDVECVKFSITGGGEYNGKKNSYGCEMLVRFS